MIVKTYESDCRNVWEGDRSHKEEKGPINILNTVLVNRCLEENNPSNKTYELKRQQKSYFDPW